MGSKQNEKYNDNLIDIKKDIGANNCPNCGSTNFIPIVYGKPTYQAYLKAKKGEL